MPQPILIEDTRNPADKHRNVHEWAAQTGTRIVRSKMVVGDYTLPADQRICVDTKAGLQEVYGNVIQDHERFRNECLLAQGLGVRLIVLVEEPGIASIDEVHKWRNPRREKWFRVQAAHKAGKMLGVKIPSKPPAPSDRLEQSMKTMTESYGVEWRFCDKAATGATVWAILHFDGSDKEIPIEEGNTAKIASQSVTEDSKQNIEREQQA
jgi:hypothetical protein